MNAEIAIGMIFAISSIAVALMEGRRLSAERDQAERITVLECRCQRAEERGDRLDARIDAIEQAQREDPHRRCHGCDR